MKFDYKFNNDNYTIKLHLEDDNEISNYLDHLEDGLFYDYSYFVELGLPDGKQYYWPILNGKIIWSQYSLTIKYFPKEVRLFADNLVYKLYNLKAFI